MSTIETGQSVEALKLASELRMFASRFILDSTIALLTNSAVALEILEAQVPDRAQSEQLLLQSISFQEQRAELAEERLSLARSERDEWSDKFNTLESQSAAMRSALEFCQGALKGLCVEGSTPARQAMLVSNAALATDAGKKIEAHVAALTARVSELEDEANQLKASELTWAASSDAYSNKFHEQQELNAKLAQDRAIVDWLERMKDGMWRKQTGTVHVYVRPRSPEALFSDDFSGPTFRAAVLAAMKAEGAK